MNLPGSLTDMKCHVHNPAKSLATAMIDRAIKDMRYKKSTDIRDYVSAVCWLGSKGSIKWFDTIDVDQESSLPRLEWDIYAKDILLDNKILLSDDQREMLTSTLKHFQCSHKGNNDV